MSGTRIQMFIGVGLLLITILAFIFTILAQLPKAEQVTANAQTLVDIPRDLFSGDNEVTKTIEKLNVPSNVPVVVDPNNLGRTNAFENF